MKTFNFDKLTKKERYSFGKTWPSAREKFKSRLGVSDALKYDFFFIKD